MRLELVEFHSAQQRPDDQNPHDETEIAETIRDKSLLARVGRSGALIPESDEQITRESDQLPKDEHLDEVVRNDNAEHGKGEETEAGEVAAHSRIFPNVAIGIDVD